MKYLLVSLDPGVDRGAAVVMDDSTKILGLSTWKSNSSASLTYRHCAVAAERLHDHLYHKDYVPQFVPGITPVILLHEGVFVPHRVKKGNNIPIPGTVPEERIYTPTAAFELCKSIGIWIAHFPDRVFTVNVSKWRALAGIHNSMGTEECKRLSVQYAKTLLGTDNINGTPIDDHVSDAYFIGKYWNDKARLTIASGKDPTVHGVEK